METSSKAEFVIRARERLGLKQPEFAAKLGLGRHAIIRYEAGEPMPKTVELAIKHLLRQHASNEQRRRKARDADATAS